MIEPIHRCIQTYLSDGDHFDFAGHTVQVIATPGHTLDMLNFYLPQQAVCFTGDTLFALGCGRIFEGTPEMMWASLEKLMKLPPETVIYSSHEIQLPTLVLQLRLTRTTRHWPNVCRQ